MPPSDNATSSLTDDEVRPSLPRRRLGSTGLEVTALGLGAAWIGLPEPDVSDEQAVKTVRRAIELGIDYIDTSPLYQESERRLGLALSEGYRDHVVLSTKTGTRAERKYDYSGEATRWSVELSLKHLRTDHLDVVLVHDPRSSEPIFERGAVLDTLEEMRDEGLLRFIGIGVRNHEILIECIDSGRFDLILTHSDYNLIYQSAAEEVIPRATERGVAIVNGSPLYMGLLSGGDPRRYAQGRRWLRESELSKAIDLRRWAKSRDIDLVAPALQYCLYEARIAVTLCGPRSPVEIERSVKGVTDPLPPELWDELETQFGVPRPQAA